MTFSYSVIVTVNVFPQQLIEVVKWLEYIEGSGWFTVACRLNLQEPSTWYYDPELSYVLFSSTLFLYLNDDNIIRRFFRISWDSLCRVVFFQTETKLPKLVLFLHRQFLHGGTTSRCNIQTPVDSSDEDLSPHTLQTAQIWYEIIAV